MIVKALCNGYSVVIFLFLQLQINGTNSNSTPNSAHRNPFIQFNNGNKKNEQALIETDENTISHELKSSKFNYMILLDKCNDSKDIPINDQTSSINPPLSKPSRVASSKYTNTAHTLHFSSKQELSKYLLSLSSKQNLRPMNFHFKATVLSALLYTGIYHCFVLPKYPHLPSLQPVFQSFSSGTTFSNSKSQKELLVVLYLLYTLEALFSSSTRKYLSYIKAPIFLQEITQFWVYQCKPIITWTLQCFHYERDGDFHHSSFSGNTNRFYINRNGPKFSSTLGNLNSNHRGSFPFHRNYPSSNNYCNGRYSYGHHDSTRKVITHRIRSLFQFHEWKNDIFVSSASSSLSKSLQSLLFPNHLFHSLSSFPSSSFSKNSHNEDAFKKQFHPFVKVKFSKCVLLQGQELSNYIAQRYRLEQQEGNRDLYTEILTSVNLPNFHRNILIDRRLSLNSEVNLQQQIENRILNDRDNAEGVGNRLLLSFWIWTGLGLTVPFRLWFDSKCDNTVDVVIVKEIG